MSNTQQCENHEFDNRGPDLARRGQVPNELGVGKVTSPFKLIFELYVFFIFLMLKSLFFAYFFFK